MGTRRHQRLHLTQGGRFLGWNADTRAEESFDLLAECLADKGAAPGDVLARCLAGDGVVTTDAFSRVLGANAFSATEKSRLEARAKEVNGRDVVDLDRTLRFQWSTAEPNRSRISVPNEFWDLEAFNLNPVGLWNHQAGGSPEAGMARWLWVGHRAASAKSNLIGYPEFVRHEVNPRATTVLGLYREGVYSAVSPGFMVGAVEFQEDDNLVIFGSAEEMNELVEQSFTPVPRNKDALLFAIQHQQVELSAVRDLITYQLEAAYSDPMQIMETARLEAWAAKLGLHRKSFVEMTVAGIEALELAGEPEAPAVDVEADCQVAMALRSGEPGDLEVDDDAWARFEVASTTADGEALSDEMLSIAARAAGLVVEADALGRTMVFEAAEEEVEENSAGDGNPGEDVAEGDETEGNGLDVASFAGLFKEALSPVAKSTGSLTGRLVIPAE